MRALALVSVAVMCASFAHAQPVSCIDDAQCYADYFCETAVHFCQKCLHCEDLKREAPILASPSSCIKSVVDCGSCLQGLMIDHRGDVNGECVPPDGSASESSLPVYIWSIIGLLILGVFIAMIIIIIYVLRRKDLFRISTATWLRSSCTSTNINASAPEAPPPYNPYTAVRSDSPFAMPDVAYTPPDDEETSHPFIKRAPGSTPQTAREAAGSQNARVFGPPSYVRIHPQSPISPLSKTEDSDHWPSIHNEDTTPHDWTPNTSITNDTNGHVTVSEIAENPESSASEAMSSDLPALLAAARDTTLVAPPAKKLKTQDNNNNGNRGAASNETSDGGVGSSTQHTPEQQPSIYFNIVQINNTKL